MEWKQPKRKGRSEVNYVGISQEQAAIVGGDLGSGTTCNALGTMHVGGCWRSTELLIVALKRSWREIFPLEEQLECEIETDGAPKGVEKDARWKSPKAGLSHRAWKSSKGRWIPTFPTPSTTGEF